MSLSVYASRMGRLALILFVGLLVFGLTAIAGNLAKADDAIEEIPGDDIGDDELVDVGDIDFVPFDIDRIQANIETLAGFGTRVSGYEGNRQAAEFMLQQFEEAGLTDVQVHEFEMTSPVDHESVLTINGADGEQVIQVHGLWPNQARTTATGPDGLEGHLAYGGTGNLWEFNNQEIRDAIVIMEFNSQNRWTNAFMLGAKAVVFIEPEDTTRQQAQNKFYQISANMPRFYVDGETGAQLRELAQNGADVGAHLYSDVFWERVTGQNVLGYVDGSDPDLADELVIINAPFDSMSVVPGVAPGAEQAVSPAVMIEMARYFAENPPPRSILFLATDGHKQAQSGIRHFIDHYKKIYGDSGDGATFSGTHPNRPVEHADELTDYLRHPNRDNAFDRREGRNSRISQTYMLSLDITSGTDTVSVTSGGDFWQISLGEDGVRAAQNYARAIGPLFRSIEEALQETLGHGPFERFFETIRTRAERTYGSFRGGVPLASDHEAWQVARGAGLVFYTVEDAQQYVDTPLDTPDRINFDNVQRQAEVLGAVLNTFLNLPEDEWVPATDVDLSGDYFQYFAGEVVEFDPRVSYIPDHPVPGALVVVSDGPKNFGGVRGMRIVQADADVGRWEMVGFIQNQTTRQWLQELTFEAFYQDPDTGLLTMFLDMGVNGTSKFPNEFESTFRLRTMTLVLIDTPTIDMYELVEQRQFARMEGVRVMDARNDAPPIEHGYQLGRAGFFTAFGEPVAMVWTNPGVPTKATMESEHGDQVFLALNADFERPTGTGFIMGEVDRVLYTPYQAAHDMWHLNESRHRLLVDNGIENPRYIQAHLSARDHLDLAEQALMAQEYDRFIDHARQAWGLSHRAYPDIRRTADDTVQGVLLYMALVLPFAFFMERLLFGFSDIRKQLAGTFGVFLLVWLILRYIHPAFELATSPLIILLAFVLMAMSLLVIWIIGGKFEEQMEQIRWKRAGVGHTDVGRAAAALAAFSLGVQNMRKRRVRTMLTCITLIILTFTVLSFMSLQPTLRETRINLQTEPNYQGLLFRERNKGQLSNEFFETMENRYRHQATVLPRSWYMSERSLTRSSQVELQSGGNSHIVNALLGLTAAEREVLPMDELMVAGRWIEDHETGVALLPESVGERLGITPDNINDGHIVRMAGMNWDVVGLFNSTSLNQIRDLDNDPILPIDYTGLGLDPDEYGDEVFLNRVDEVLDLTYYSAGSVVIVPYETVLSLPGGSLHVVALDVGDTALVQAIVTDMLQQVTFYIYAGIGDQTFVHSSTDFFTAEGAGNVIIPLIIAALIVLNTMLGSVYERTREIEIYNAVGLAPSHIGALFIAESIVYAVIGAVAGYVVGQGFSVLLVTYDWLPELSLNYSSTQTLFAVGIIMVTVIASTIYPAKQASRLAAPSDQRTWSLPDPEEGVMEGHLPFSISGGEEIAVLVFLQQYVVEHGEIATDFQSTGGRFFKTEDEEGRMSYVLEFDAHLAPFDLGVVQRTQIITENVIGDEYDVLFRFINQSGDTASWKRTGHYFMRSLRKQFLIWRTVDPDEKGNYQQQGVELLERGTFDVGS